MREFFSGWRRKFGVVLLVLSCALLVGWLRSLSSQDTFTIGFGSSIQFKLVSISGRMIIAQVSMDGDRPIRTVPWTSKKAIDDVWELVFQLPDGAQVIWQHAISEDLYSTGTDEMGANFMSFAVKWCQFPYWSLVIPFTLLSSYFLLSKNPKSTQLKITEPTANERA